MERGTNPMARPFSTVEAKGAKTRKQRVTMENATMKPG